ncbi:MAG: TIGR02444 family protein [Halioglobus sp.]|nr:TIGR02444 family protein [Halioglobus sp.]
MVSAARNDEASNPFWDYSLSVYARPGVAAACLALQDDCGLDVNTLLYAAWLASMGLDLSREHLQQVEAAVDDWRARVVRPLRELRVSLRDFEPAVALREELTALELQAERGQQDLMYALYTAYDPGTRPDALQHNLALVLQCRAGGGSRPEEALRRLLALLS